MTSTQFEVDEISSAYWRISFANGPLNLLDENTVVELAGLLTRMEQEPALTVAVFTSSNPDYFMAHWDVRSGRDRIAALPPTPTGLDPYLDNLIRLSRLPLLTVSAVRGRARGAGSEFVLATDVRFAGDRAVLGQFEVAAGAVPGGGPMARLPRLVGRGRALEILLGADDFPAGVAAAYGYVNRVVPDAELDAFTDAFARRVAGFDKTAVRETKELVDVASLPPEAEFPPGHQAFGRSLRRPGMQERFARLFTAGFQQPGNFELDLGARIAGTPVEPTEV
ncbi:enoyl-CoA hydratase/isomerase family protein [Paractinoplanes toevensis]|uniref:Enoyl-CoA hydratase n=1 Tax=Paractinoplanes toevensis TaxID=571911 RepID=A0A919W5I7_9ACTN|nr:enoyl-CoA hydratase/isomerase family protein [Actinoplanes toevensis]GIM93005.1 enoyl-CoA hydratase [Actinoplanes toevensis]